MCFGKNNYSIIQDFPVDSILNVISISLMLTLSQITFEINNLNKRFYNVVQGFPTWGTRPPGGPREVSK